MKLHCLGAAALCLSSAVFASSALAAETITLTEDSGVYEGSFSGEPSGAGSFSHEYEFTVPEDGLTSGTISTNFTTGGDIGNIDFISVLLNGVAFTLTGPGQFEFGSLGDLSVLAGLQTLVVNGTSAGAGVYTGEITFVPTPAVPEPATWALMILGFAAIGAFMRRGSQNSGQRLRVTYS